MPFSLSTERRAIEESWRIKLEEASERYNAARSLYRQLLIEAPEGLTPSTDGPVAMARRTEAEALAEYTRVLKVFTELTVHGTMPQQPQANTAAGGVR